MTDTVVLLVEDNERNLKLARDVLEYGPGSPFSWP